MLDDLPYFCDRCGHRDRPLRPRQVGSLLPLLAAGSMLGAEMLQPAP